MGQAETRLLRGDELDAGTLYRLLALRSAVFVVEQDCPYQDIDGRDLRGDTLHLLAEQDGALTGYLRVLAEPGGGHRIGRVCTSSAARSTGLGAVLMAAALAALGDTGCVLDAQTYATGFYRRFGFVAEGAEFLDDGIPHITMRRAG